jgi:MSHA biogenesis protein MshO
LAEAVIVIVITGIVAGMTALFTRLPIQGYIQSEARAQLTDVANTAFLRMSRDLSLALPNSVRTTTVGANRYIEFLLTKTAGRHLAAEDIATLENPTGDILSFTDSTKKIFDVLGPMPTGPQAIVTDDFIVVYNTGTSPTDAYQCDGTPLPAHCNRSKVSEVNGSKITLTENRFAGLTLPPSASPGRGFQVVTSAVTYECNPSSGALTRYSGYGVSPIQPPDSSAPPLANGAVLAQGITACSFSYNAFSAGSNLGLVGLSLTVRAATGSEEIALSRQVYVDNTP